MPGPPSGTRGRGSRWRPSWSPAPSGEGAVDPPAPPGPAPSRTRSLRSAPSPHLPSGLPPAVQASGTALGPTGAVAKPSPNEGPDGPMGKDNGEADCQVGEGRRMGRMERREGGSEEVLPGDPG